MTPPDPKLVVGLAMIIVPAAILLFGSTRLLGWRATLSWLALLCTLLAALWLALFWVLHVTPATP